MFKQSISYRSITTEATRRRRQGLPSVPMYVKVGESLIRISHRSAIEAARRKSMREPGAKVKWLMDSHRDESDPAGDFDILTGFSTSLPNIRQQLAAEK